MSEPFSPYNPLAIQSIAESLVRELLNQQCEPLPPAQRFNGAGIYVIYYRGPFPEYWPIARQNQVGCEAPIYIGKAIPRGGRKGVNVATGATTQALVSRLTEHAESIKAASSLELADFRCKYRVIEDLFIELAERTVIQLFKPLWNTILDGFGNHDLAADGIIASDPHGMRYTLDEDGQRVYNRIQSHATHGSWMYGTI